MKKITMKKLILTLPLLLGFAIYNSVAHATDFDRNTADFWTVFQQAVQSDPTYQAADASRLSNQEDVPISRAALLPNLSGAANTTANRLHVVSPALNNELDNLGIAGSNNYNTHGYQLNLTQQIFNFADWMQLSQSDAIAQEADYTYGASLQDLIIRVANAYFGVLQAEDTLRYTEAQKQANLESLQQIKARYEVGTQTLTDVDQALASYDALDAQVISASNNVANSMESLRQITGQTYAELAPLKANIPLITPNPVNSEDWVHAAENCNLTLLAARYNVEADRSAIKVAYAGHFPTLDAVGSYQYNVEPNSQVGALVGEESASQFSGGLQVAVPIFEGGLVVAQTHQAEDNFNNASDIMEVTHRQVVATARQSYNNVMADISKITADRLAVTFKRKRITSN